MGDDLRFLREPTSWPLVGRLRQRLIETYPRARFSAWSAIPLQQIHDGAQLAFGAAYETRIDLSKASVIASLDADLLAALPGNLRTIKDWAAKRVPSAGPMARLYVGETNLSVTGMNADHRLRLKPSQIQRFGLALLGRLAGRVPALSRYAPLAEPLPPPGPRAQFARALARDLVRGGSGALVAGCARPAPLPHAVARG